MLWIMKCDKDWKSSAFRSPLDILFLTLSKTSSSLFSFRLLFRKTSNLNNNPPQFRLFFSEHCALHVSHVLKMNRLLMLLWNKWKRNLSMSLKWFSCNIFLNKVQFSLHFWRVLPYSALFQDTEHVVNSKPLKEVMMSLLWQYELENHTQGNHRHNYNKHNLTTNRSKALVWQSLSGTVSCPQTPYSSSPSTFPLCQPPSLSLFLSHSLTHTQPSHPAV